MREQLTLRWRIAHRAAASVVVAADGSTSESRARGRRDRHASLEVARAERRSRWCPGRRGPPPAARDGHPRIRTAAGWPRSWATSTASLAHLGIVATISGIGRPDRTCLRHAAIEAATRRRAGPRLRGRRGRFASRRGSQAGRGMSPADRRDPEASGEAVRVVNEEDRRFHADREQITSVTPAREIASVSEETSRQPSRSRPRRADL